MRVGSLSYLDWVVRIAGAVMRLSPERGCRAVNLSAKRYCKKQYVGRIAISSIVAFLLENNFEITIGNYIKTPLF
jgi:hypothetical protein